MINIVYYYQDHCPACSIAKWTWSRLQRYRPEWGYAEKNISKDPDALHLLLSMDISVTPAFIIYNDGIFVGKLTGAMRVHDMIKQIDDMIY